MLVGDSDDREATEKPKLELVIRRNARRPASGPSILMTSKVAQGFRDHGWRKVIKGAITVGKPKNNIYFRCHPTVFP